MVVVRLVELLSLAWIGLDTLILNNQLMSPVVEENDNPF
jgi:hypothetical protein